MTKTALPRKFIPLALVFALVVLCPTHRVPRVQAAPAPRRIEVTAKRFAFAPSEVALKKGEPVVLVLKSEDVAHGVKFDELHLKTEIGKDAAAELAFTPDQAGTFVGHCSHFCGSGHGEMTLTLHVTE
jgi:cytochrome c oxidase subunit II